MAMSSIVQLISIGVNKEDSLVLSLYISQRSKPDDIIRQIQLYNKYYDINTYINAIYTCIQFDYYDIIISYILKYMKNNNIQKAIKINVQYDMNDVCKMKYLSRQSKYLLYIDMYCAHYPDYYSHAVIKLCYNLGTHNMTFKHVAPSIIFL